MRPRTRFTAVMMTLGTTLGLMVLAPGVARAQMTPSGAKHTLAIDQLSGFRASSIGGINYAGPIGFATQSASATRFNNGPGQGDDVTRFTTFWLAPSADFFVIDHLSVGALIELSTTSTSVDREANGVTQTFQLPSTTSLTLLPRVGYLIGVTERFAIWPRAGLGYVSRQVVSGAVANPTRDSTYGALADVDVGFLYRLTNNVFLRAAPEMTFSLGASHASTVGNTTLSANASVFQFAATAGVGVFLDL